MQYFFENDPEVLQNTNFDEKKLCRSTIWKMQMIFLIFLAHFYTKKHRPNFSEISIFESKILTHFLAQFCTFWAQICQKTPFYFKHKRKCILQNIFLQQVRKGVIPWPWPPFFWSVIVSFRCVISCCECFFQIQIQMAPNKSVPTQKTIISCWDIITVFTVTWPLVTSRSDKVKGQSGESLMWH